MIKVAVFHVWFLSVGISLNKHLQKTTTWIQIEQIDEEILKAAIWIFENDFEIACENGQHFKSKTCALKYKNGIL